MGPTQILCFWEAVEKSSACFLSFQAGPSCFTPLLSEGPPGGVFYDLEALKPAPNSGVTPLYYYYQNFLIWIWNYWLLNSTWKHLQTRGLKKEPSWTQAPLPPHPPPTHWIWNRSPWVRNKRMGEGGWCLHARKLSRTTKAKKIAFKWKKYFHFISTPNVSYNSNIILCPTEIIESK